MSMDLYRIDLSYEDVLGRQEWEEELEKVRDHREAPPPPERKRFTCHAAVYPGWAGSPVQRACDLAVETIVGPREKWDRWMPMIHSVAWLGSVAVEEIPAQNETEQSKG